MWTEDKKKKAGKGRMRRGREGKKKRRKGIILLAPVRVHIERGVGCGSELFGGLLMNGGSAAPLYTGQWTPFIEYKRIWIGKLLSSSALPVTIQSQLIYICLGRKSGLYY